MNRAELTRDIREATGCGGTISRSQLARYLNISRNDRTEKIEIYIAGLDYIPDGRGRRYFVKERSGEDPREHYKTVTEVQMKEKIASVLISLGVTLMLSVPGAIEKLMNE